MKAYTTPELEIIEFETEDVITTSLTVNPGQNEMPVVKG